MGKIRIERKADRDGDRFVALPHVVLESQAYRSLNHASRSLLMDICLQLFSANNGKLSASAKALRPLGWNSNDTINRALHQLLDNGLLVETRKGACPHKAAWYAVTWVGLVYRDGMEMLPRDFPRGAYSKQSPRPLISHRRRTAAATATRQLAGIYGYSVVPSNGATKQGIAPSGGAIRDGAAPKTGSISPVSTRALAPSNGTYLEKPSAAAPPMGDAGKSMNPSSVPRERRSAKRLNEKEPQG